MPTSSHTPLPSIPPPQRRTRSERVALYSSSHGFFPWITGELRRDHQGFIFVVMLLTSIALALLIRSWEPPMEFGLHDVPSRAIVCNTAFSISSPEGKQRAEERARWESLHVYVNDPKPLVQLRESLWNTVAAMVNAHSFDRLDEKGKKAWLDFLRPVGQGAIPENIVPREAFDAFVTIFKDDTSLDLFNTRLKRAFTPFEVHGMLNSLNFGPEQGNQDQILVYRIGETPDRAVPFKVSQVLIRDGSRIKEALQREFNNSALVEQFFNWFAPKLEETLKEDRNATAEAQQKAVAAVGDIMIDYTPGQVLVEAGVPLNNETLALLQAEYRAFLKNLPLEKRLTRFSAITLGIFTMLSISWGFARRLERRRPKTPQAFIALMTGMIATTAAAHFLHGFPLTAADWEIMPLMLFVMTVSITYSWELSIIFSVILALVLSLSAGGEVGLLIILLGVSVVTAIQLGRLRSRKKLVVVSVTAGIVAFALTLAVGLLSNRPLETPLILDASINFVWSFLAGLFMTGLLPFIEEPFGILTDMSLLELGDVSHPLLQSLIRLAPATYGHSMQVGTIAETAAEAIGARGLLTRVGAYFHDIGKIMKPEYYSENQGGMTNIHDTLEPQISTIVVIAHVKDGVDLARQHRLPQPLIDLIEQHHGTSLVSFFYGRAAKANKDDQHQVEESTFRYPGPKPQMKEAAILMIADACESACRSMGAAATPGKIENKVHVIIKQKLDDGQFDDSGLTLRELKIIENSVIKSIIAAMHGRIKYPEQETEMQISAQKSDLIKSEKSSTEASAPSEIAAAS